MKYIIWGCGTRGAWMKRKLERESGADVIAFADNNLGKLGKKVEGIPVISVWKLKKEYADCGVVIPGIFGEMAVRMIVEQLLDAVKKENIYVVPCTLFLKEREDVCIKDIFVPLEKWTQIDNLGIKLTNHCNLNCRRCNNFSNIAEKDYYRAEDLEPDIRRLSTLIPDVLNIKLIGGEPLLNAEIPECIQAVKKYYPYSHYYLVTNGLLLKNPGQDVLRYFKENNINVMITLYPILQDSIDEIAAKLSEAEVSFGIYRSGDYFIPILNEEGRYHPNYIKNQDKVKCVSFFKGEICRCTVGLSISAYNQKFHKSFPETESIDIYREDMTGEKLMRMLDEPMELCRYCNGCYSLNEKDYGDKWALGKAEWEDWMEKTGRGD